MPLQYQPSKKFQKHKKTERSKLPPLEETQKSGPGQQNTAKQTPNLAAGAITLPANTAASW